MNQGEGYEDLLSAQAYLYVGLTENYFLDECSRMKETLPKESTKYGCVRQCCISRAMGVVDC